MATYSLIHADCFNWLREQPPASVHAVCTDPPYGLIEFTRKEVTKLRNGNRGGVWRIPPSIGGHERDPLPRFTTLTGPQRRQLYEYMRDWGRLLSPVLAPGAHVCVAGHPMLQYLVQGGMAEAGYEVRPALLRVYTSFRGGDRPKNAEAEFPGVCVTPRSAYEPWMLFRKPISEPHGGGQPAEVENRGPSSASGGPAASRGHSQLPDPRGRGGDFQPSVSQTSTLPSDCRPQPAPARRGRRPGSLPRVWLYGGGRLCRGVRCDRRRNRRGLLRQRRDDDPEAGPALSTIHG